MNKSEIAERGRNMKAVEQSEKLWEKHFSHAETELSKKGMFCYGYEFGYADGERAIAESQAPQPEPSRYCTCKHPMASHIGRNWCSERDCKCRLYAELGDGEPSQAPAKFEVNADELLGVWCNGDGRKIFAHGKIPWENWSRLAEYINGKIERSEFLARLDSNNLALEKAEAELAKWRSGAAQEVSPVPSNSERDSKWIDAIQEALGDMGRIGDRHYFTFCLFLVMREAAKADLIDQDQHVEEMLEKLRPKIAESQKKLCAVDTRELKAALREMIDYAKHGTVGEEAWPEDLADAEKLLG